MNNTAMIALVLVGAVVVGAVYFVSQDTAPVILSGGTAGGDPNRPEATGAVPGDRTRRP